MNSQNLTLEQIGKRAGVSRSTVSRVVNDQRDVRPEVRARVAAVIEETGYLPNHAARALVSSRSRLIGLVMLTEIDELFGDPYYSALVEGIRQGCVEHGLTLSIFPVHDPKGRDDILTAQGFVDGVIVTAGPRSDGLISVLRDRGKRLVVVGHPVDDAGLLRIDVENRAGGAAATAHLLKHGRRRVGFVGANSEYVFSVERLEGYRDAFAAAGRDVEDSLIRVDHPTLDGGYRATASLLSEHPDAIYVATDVMAIGAYRALSERALRVPEDVAIVGFDGFPRGARLEPSLTTIVQPVADVGRTAVAMLAAETGDVRTVILPTTLRVGASCGADEAARRPCRL